MPRCRRRQRRHAPRPPRAPAALAPQLPAERTKPGAPCTSPSFLALGRCSRPRELQQDGEPGPGRLGGPIAGGFGSLPPRSPGGCARRRGAAMTCQQARNPCAGPTRRVAATPATRPPARPLRHQGGPAPVPERRMLCVDPDAGASGRLSPALGLAAARARRPRPPPLLIRSVAAPPFRAGAVSGYRPPQPSG